MNKIVNVFYVFICLLLCILPFAGMLVMPTDSTTENRKMAVFPKILEDGKWNRTYLQEMGNYFEDHFAFRPIFVTVDSVIQSRVFEVSNMDTVIVGKNGWLYYTATLDDYLGRNTLSERALYNVAHNVSLMQRYTEEKGADFLFTIAPNKNSLYGDNMPYYDRKIVSSTNNMTLLPTRLKEFEISYADLFKVFKDEKEVLYLKRDSHWNQKGAVYVYYALMEQLECEYDTYDKSIRTKTEYGDLNKMMYPVGFAAEWNYNYQKEHVYTYVTQTKSVEDARIYTKNPEGAGSLLMFRDSFGNTLLPLLADAFEEGVFLKTVPYSIEEYMDIFSPEYVIVEKVERNISEFATTPPIMTGPIVTLDTQVENADTKTTLDMEESEYNASYWAVSGRIDEDWIEQDTNIYIRITTEDETKIYEAYSVSTENADDGYLLYVHKKKIPSDWISVEVLTQTNGTIQRVAQNEFYTSQLSVSGETK